MTNTKTTKRPYQRPQIMKKKAVTRATLFSMSFTGTSGVVPKP